MSLVRNKDTKPEIFVRRLVHSLGFRYRLHLASMAGRPDIVLRRLRKVIFVHGCFWHRHDCPSGRKVPVANPDYWRPKLDRNLARDTENLARLHALGWATLTVWECELSNPAAVAARLSRFLD